MKIVRSAKTIRQTIALLFYASKPYFLLTICFNVFSGCFIPVNVLIWKYIVDATTDLLRLKDASYMPVVYFLLLHFGISFLIRSISTLSVYFQNLYASKINMYITNKILYKMSELTVEQFDNPSVYDNIQKSNGESLQRSTSILRTLVEILKNGVSVVGTAGLLFHLHAGLTTAAICTCIPLFFINIAVSNKLYALYEKRSEKIRFINYLKSISMDNTTIKEMKINNVFCYFIKKISDIYCENFNEDKAVRKKIFLQRNIYQFFDELIFYGIKLWIILLGIKSAATIGSVLMFMQSVDILKNAINNTLSMGSQGYEDSLYMENLFNLLELTGDRGEAPFNRHFHTIECRNVWFTYPFSDIPVIKDFSFCFSADKTYGFVGLNGSGKTTLIKLLLGFYTSYQGSILIDGIELRDIDIKQYHTHISAVFQDFVRYPFTVTENIGLGDEALFLTQDGVKTITENEAVYQAAHFSKADEFIRKLPNQYASILGKEWQNGTQISIGQWQKIAVARAAVKKSRIFIFDEPTASIDPISEYEFFKNVRSLAQNSLCILVTHRFANIKAADEILVLSDGALIQSGTHQELFDSEGLYRELYTMQAESYLEDKT